MFLYYLPKLSKETFSPAAIQAAGLSDVLGDCLDALHVCGVGNARGPGDTSGVIVSYASPITGVPKHTSYQPEMQDWTQVSDLLWIGVSNPLPTPDDLQRIRTVPGSVLRDDHGHEWAFPTARSSANTYGMLPQTYGFDFQTGEPIGRLDERWRWVWDLSGEVWDYFNRPTDQQVADMEVEAEPETWDFAKVLRTAVKILSVNYRLGLHEVTILNDHGRGMLNQQLAFAVLASFIDWDFAINLTEEKKSAVPSSSNLTPGDETPAAVRATDQRERTYTLAAS